MTGSAPRPPIKVITRQLRLAAEAIREGHNWGTAIIKTKGLSMSATYQMLRRMRDAGWVTWEEETVEAAAADRRSPRRFYTLTSTATEALGWRDQ